MAGAVVVEEDAEGAIPGACSERGVDDSAGGAVLLRAEGMDCAVTVGGGVFDFPGNGAGECRDAECGAGEPACNGDGGAVVCNSRAGRYAVVEGDWDYQRCGEPADWYGGDTD